MTRPAHNDALTHQNWRQRETLTTDGSSGFGTALVVAGSELNLTLRWLVYIENPLPATTLVVLAGPGVGLRREVVAYSNATSTLLLADPLGMELDPNASVVAVVSTFGTKAIGASKRGRVALGAGDAGRLG